MKHLLFTITQIITPEWNGLIIRSAKRPKEKRYKHPVSPASRDRLHRLINQPGTTKKERKSGPLWYYKTSVYKEAKP
jgi:hypothetical protein